MDISIFDTSAILSRHLIEHVILRVWSGCFIKFENGTIQARITEDTAHFEELYEMTHSCFNAHKKTNDTCEECFSEYTELNDLYIKVQEGYGTELCLDIVDTVSI